MPQKGRTQPALQSDKPKRPIGKTQRQGMLSSQPFRRVDSDDSGPSGTQDTEFRHPWAPVSRMSTLMVPIPWGPTCLGPLRERHRGPPGRPGLMTFRQDILIFGTLPLGDLDQSLCHVGPRAERPPSPPLSHPYTAPLKAFSCSSPCFSLPTSCPSPLFIHNLEGKHFSGFTNSSDCRCMGYFLTPERTVGVPRTPGELMV